MEPLAGRELLNAGCGTGLALRPAADRDAVVSGLDASAPLLEVAHGRTPQAGLRTGDIQALPYADHDQAWTAHVSAGPLRKVIEIAGPDAVRRVMRDVLEADRKPDGELRQDNVFRYVAATKE